MSNRDFISVLKKYTNIDATFINTFFKNFKIGGELEFSILDKDVAKYLQIEIQSLRNRLNNKNDPIQSFIENVDFIKVKHGKGSTLSYMLNYPCFERVAMGGTTPRSELVRSYFVKLRQFLTEHQQVIYQAMENKQDLSAYGGYESIYFFAVDERHPNIFKVGRTMDVVKRLRNYNVGRIKEVDLKYFAIVKNAVIIERCIKNKLNKHQVFKGREIYKVTPQVLKQVIDDCYCKSVSKKQNDDMYRELSDMLGLYAYTKDKVNIHPYVIIGKDIK